MQVLSVSGSRAVYSTAAGQEEHFENSSHEADSELVLCGGTSWFYTYQPCSRALHAL